MRFNPFAKPEAMTDAELDEVAQEAELTTAALAEREKRIEERRVEAEKKAAEEARTEKRATVDALAKEHAFLADEVAKASDALGASICSAADLLEARDAALREVWRVRLTLKDLGVEPPPFGLSFTPEAMAAGRRIAPLISYELIEGPLASATRNNPDAFRR